MSDLLNSASLVLIPSGYKEDTVYSVVPSDGSGDLSFTRASNGTRINSAGLVEVCPWNLFRYSNDFSNAAWTKYNATLTSGQSDPFGGNNAWKFQAILSAQSDFRQTVTGASSYSFYAKAGSVSEFRLWSGSSGTIFDTSTGTVASGSGTIESVGNGWYRCTILTSTTGSVTLIPYFVGNANDYIYIAFGQAQASTTAKPYFPTTDRLNVPRLTYQNGGGGCPSLLLEKQSTNLVYPSEDFSPWNLFNSATISTNTTISPDGTQNADTLNFASSAISQVFSNQGDGTNTAHTVSIYAKSSSGKKFRIKIANSTTGGDEFSSNLTTTNDWQRFDFTFTCPVTHIAICNESSGGTGTIQIWGAQLEASSYPTSYIPTTSASATRVADVMSVNLPNTDMTFCAYLECEEAPLGTTVGDWLSIYSDISILGRAYGYANTFGFADAYGMGVTSATKMVWKQESGTTAKLFKNGALAATSTTGTYSDPFNRFRIDGAYLDKPLKIKEFVFFQNNLTDACAALTL